VEYKAPIESYSGAVREITIGKGAKALKIGGENTFAFHSFDEGSSPNPAKFALEVYDMEPRGWADWVLEPFKDVVSDPIKWAKRCVDYGADAICLQLLSTDPTEKDTSPEEAAALAKRVAEAIDVPLIILCSEDDKKDAQVLHNVAEV